MANSGRNANFYIARANRGMHPNQFPKALWEALQDETREIMLEYVRNNAARSTPFPPVPMGGWEEYAQMVAKHGRDPTGRDKPSGYVGYSMSVRAAEAYREGKLPISKIRKQHLSSAGIAISLKDFHRLVKSGDVRATEWHHTSKHYNRTDFFDLDSIAEDCGDLTAELQALNQRETQAKKR